MRPCLGITESTSEVEGTKPSIYSFRECILSPAFLTFVPIKNYTCTELTLAANCAQNILELKLPYLVGYKQLEIRVTLFGLISETDMELHKLLRNRIQPRM
jgi:hypothetical protein